MSVRAAVVPHPPLLVPELVVGAAAETAPIREACVAAARRLAAVSPDWVAIAPVGPESDGPAMLEGLCGTFGGFGVDVRVALLPPDPGEADCRDVAARLTRDAAIPPALRGLDRRLATELGVSGWGPWQVLAAVFAAATTEPARVEELYSDAPYGVGYHVAVWGGGAE